jgi:hypothetical protein
MAMAVPLRLLDDDVIICQSPSSAPRKFSQKKKKETK